MSRLRVAILLSGTGRTLQNLLEHRQTRDLPVDVVAVASNKPGVRGLAIAEEAGIPTAVFPRAAFADPASRDAALFAWVGQHRPQLIALAGYLALLRLDGVDVPVLNIHPSLLPRFGGKGFYGDRVHEAVLAAGEDVSGATVHVVDAEFDRGPVVDQIQVPVRAGDDVRSLAARVFEAECELYPRVLRAVAEGRLRLAGGRIERA